MAGWLSLSATEMMAWATMTGNLVTLQEWRMLRDMDSAFLVAVQKKGDQPASAAVPGEGQEINVRAFDAVFG